MRKDDLFEDDKFETALIVATVWAIAFLLFCAYLLSLLF